ncbi:MAG: hypothetical protein LWY06_11780 [Firmicutes bacterium]|nr:hypothetical protein [Bacillota bacterium]
MTGMANAAAMAQMVNRDYQNMQLIQPGVQQLNNDKLTWGAKAGTINKDEFVNLGSYMNETNRLRGIYEKGGLNPEERAKLADRQQQYDQMYQRYSYGDYHPMNIPSNGIEARQNNQLGRIYDGAAKGNLTRGETNGLLNQQQGISKLQGNFQQQGSWWNSRLNAGERNSLNNKLDDSSDNINKLKHNWSSDFNTPNWWKAF